MKEKYKKERLRALPFK